MNSKTLQHLHYFKDKVCTIITTGMNRNFNEEIAREHFAVRVGDISVDGIWGTHPYNIELVSFFKWDHIISIHREYEIDPEDPEHAKIIEEYKQKTGESVKSDLKEDQPAAKNALPVLSEKETPVTPKGTGDANFIDLDSLENLAESTRRAFKAYESFGQD